MKKMIKCLAAVSVIIAATFVTSCNKTELSETASGKVVTLTVLPPSASETKVAINDDGVEKLAVTGWSMGDKITVGAVIDEVFESSVFTCGDPAAGTFTGTLPSKISDVEDLELAIYNGVDAEYLPEYESVDFFPPVLCSSDVKDVIMMAALNDGNGVFEMEVIGSILKVNNEGSAVECALKEQSQPDIYYPCGSYYPVEGEICGDIYSEDFEDVCFTLQKGVSYVYLPRNDYELSFGLVNEAGIPIVPYKMIEYSGAIYAKTISDLKVAKYEDFLGNWTMFSHALQDDIPFTVEEKVKGKTYTIKNFLAYEDYPLLDCGSTDIEARFDSAHNCLAVDEQVFPEYKYESMEFYDALSGYFCFEGDVYPAYPINVEEPSELFRGYLLEDGTVSICCGGCDYGAFVGLGGSYVATENEEIFGGYGTIYDLPNVWKKGTSSPTSVKSHTANPAMKRTPGKRMLK